MLRVIVFGLALLQGVAAYAQSSPPNLGLIDALPPGYVDRLIAAVRDRIHVLVLDDGSNVPRESPAERARPLLPHGVERRIIEAGMRSGTARHCRIDWQSHFREMMAFERRTGSWSDKQTSYMGGLHGAGQGITMDGSKPCEADLREKVAATQTRWIAYYRSAR